MVVQQGGHRVRPPLTSLGSAVYIKKRLCLAVSIAIAGLPAAHAQSTANATPDGSADAATLDRIEVRPQFESQMRAIDFKRDSDAIKDVVSSDAMGQYPDKNVAESLQRLPGVSVTRDQGEGRYVVIRGLDAALNSVSVDGGVCTTWAQTAHSSSSGSIGAWQTGHCNAAASGTATGRPAASRRASKRSISRRAGTWRPRV